MQINWQTAKKDLNGRPGNARHKTISPVSVADLFVEPNMSLKRAVLTEQIKNKRRPDDDGPTDPLSHSRNSTELVSL